MSRNRGLNDINFTCLIDAVRLKNTGQVLLTVTLVKVSLTAGNNYQFVKPGFATCHLKLLRKMSVE